MNIKELNEKIEDNTQKIQHNLHQIKNNTSKIEHNSQRIQKNSYALEILKDYKRQNKRLFAILIAELVVWIVTLVLFHM